QFRKQISEYSELEFKNCSLDKFPVGNFNPLSHIKSITAKNVGLSLLNRDSFNSFTSLEILDLSFNNVTEIESTVLINLKSLKSFNISHNQIESINLNAFDDCSTSLSIVDLSHNRIQTIDTHIFDALGTNKNSSLYLAFNNIEEVKQSAISSTGSKTLNSLDLRHNKIKKFSYKCQSVDNLLLSDNYLEEIDTSSCEFKNLDIKNNSLTSVSLMNVKSLQISDNINLKNVSLDFKSLRKLGAANIPLKIVTYELLHNSSQLIELDVSNTFLGTPKIETFSEMALLEDLKLRNTGLTHIEYGMFGHQVYVRNFDISYNNLGYIDIEMLSSMKSLESLDISGNNLTYFNDVNDFKRNFPNLTLIGIEENNWNCSYLTKVVKIFYENSISIKQPVVPIKSSSNVMGIGCTTTSNLKIKPIDPDHAKDLVSQKLNEIIEQMNADKVSNNNAKYDGDIIRAELFHLQREVIEIKSKLLRSQITEVINNKNDSKGVDSAVIKHIEQLTNFTLDKQKLTYDQLKLELDKLQVELSKNFIEHDKFVQKNNLKDFHFSNKEVANFDNFKSSNEGNNNPGTTIVLLTIVITILTVIGVMFGYKKLKNLLYRRNETPSVLARSTNTMNTTVEIPFDGRKF
ncbi:chaoptin-like, partial [Chironomus tepperi]|uniref:chaoptin-like n=1 Tax=Chironomus tepperi TaxID=113505 RepID=UPI00391F3EB5